MDDQDDATSRGKKSGEEVQEGKTGKSAGEEETKRRRGRPPRNKTGEKGEDKDKGSLTKYLEIIKGTGGEEEIKRGRELQRTPVKKVSAGETTAEKEGDDDAEEVGERAAEQQKKKMAAGDEADELGATDGEEELKKTKAVSESEGVSVSEDVSVSESVSEWLRNLAVKMRVFEIKLGSALEAAEIKDREIKLLQEENRCRDLVIVKLKSDIVNLERQVGNNKDRIKELENRMGERLENGTIEARVIGVRGRDKSTQGGKGSGVSQGLSDREDGHGEEESSESDESERAGSVNKLGERKVGGRAEDRNQLESGSAGGEGVGGGTENASNECEESAVSVERDYLKCKPTALSEIEFKCEMEESEGDDASERRGRRRKIRNNELGVICNGISWQQWRIVGATVASSR